MHAARRESRLQDNIDPKRPCRSPRARLLAATALASGVLVAACGGSSNSPGIASASGTTTSTSSPARSHTASASRSHTATTSISSGRATPSKGSAGLSLVEWATCMRRHGDPNQADPTIDVHGGINIDIRGTAAEALSNAVHNGTASCNAYLAAAAAALRAGARDLRPPDQAALLRYSQCMRANGVPNYPDPGTGGTTNFNGTGIDPNSQFFLRANNVCGKKIHAPSWWISGAGPPGDISVQSEYCGTSPCPPGGGASGANRPRRGASGTGPAATAG